MCKPQNLLCSVNLLHILHCGSASATKIKITERTNMEVRRLERMKQCPYCAEEILAAAIKCKHCGSHLSDHPEMIALRAPSRQEVPAPTVYIRGPFKVMLWIIIIIVGSAWLFSKTHPD